MHGEDQRIQPNLPATSHPIRPDRPVSWPGICLQSPVEMWRAVGRLLWKAAEIYMAAFAGILTGFFFGVVAAIALVGFLWYDLALCVIVFCIAGGGLLFAILAWRDQPVAANSARRNVTVGDRDAEPGQGAGMPSRPIE